MRQVVAYKRLKTTGKSLHLHAKKVVTVAISRGSTVIIIKTHQLTSFALENIGKIEPMGVTRKTRVRK